MVTPLKGEKEARLLFDHLPVGMCVATATWASPALSG